MCVCARLVLVEVNLAEDWLPADLADAVQFRKNNKEMAAAGGPVYVLAMLGKEGPWRKSLKEAWCELRMSERLMLPLLVDRAGPKNDTTPDIISAGRVAHKVGCGIVFMSCGVRTTACFVFEHALCRTRCLRAR